MRDIRTLEEMESEINQLRTQLAEQSAKMEEMEQQFGEAVGTIDSLERRNTSLELQAGAMREALMSRRDKLLKIPPVDSDDTTEGWIQAISWMLGKLPTQAGADQSARVQAFNDLKLRHERLAVAARALWDAIPDYDWNFIAKDDGETDRAISEATNKLHAALSQEQATPTNV